MKRWILTLCTLAMLLSAVVTPAFAAKAHGRRCLPLGEARANCGTYVDADDDGVCDNRAADSRGGNFTDADDDGVCDNRAADSRGGNFTDADNDGVCDNRGSRGSGRQGRHCRKNR